MKENHESGENVHVNPDSKFFLHGFFENQQNPNPVIMFREQSVSPSESMEKHSFPVIYSRVHIYGQQKIKAFMTFTGKRNIEIRLGELGQPVKYTLLVDISGGIVTGYTASGETSLKVCYIFYYTGDYLHLCPLADSNHTRKMVLSGNWRSERNLAKPIDNISG